MHTLLLLLALGQCPGGVCPPRNYRSYAPPLPTVWQLTDNSGMTWTHQDLGYLQQWVATQNAPKIETPPKIEEVVSFRFH